MIVSVLRYFFRWRQCHVPIKFVGIRVSALLVSALLVGTMVPCYAQESSAETAVARIEGFKMEASSLGADQIFDEMERLLAVIALKSKGFSLPDLRDEDTLKATAYSAVLEAKRRQEEPRASYHWARYQARICRAVNDNRKLTHLSPESTFEN